MTDSRKHTIIGYSAGIIAGVAYGTNPLFGKDLLSGGASVSGILFFRYLFAAILLGTYMLAKKESFKVNARQVLLLGMLGILFSMSSLTLFSAYRFVPAGLATTIIYLYPVFTAVIMAFLKVRPSWQVLLSIAATILGVFILMNPLDGSAIDWRGALLSAASALVYAVYLVIVNRSSLLRDVSARTITFYALASGTLLFLVCHISEGTPFLQGIQGIKSWCDLVALGFVPTMVAMLTLAIATRDIGPSRTGVLGVFEPITAIAIGTLAFGEPLTANIVAGVLICMAAVIFMILSGRKCT